MVRGRQRHGGFRRRGAVNSQQERLRRSIRPSKSGKDDGGNVIFDETIETRRAARFYLTITPMPGRNSPPTSGHFNRGGKLTMIVEFAITTPEGSWKATDQTLADVYIKCRTRARLTPVRCQEFTGTVTASESLDGATQSRVDVVLLDQDGNIEGGFQDRRHRARQAAGLRHLSPWAPAVRELCRVRQPWAEADAACKRWSEQSQLP